MPILLAVDAGGTSTRALLVDEVGRCHGYGRAAGGNPTSRGVLQAVQAIADAGEQARAHSDGGLADPELAVIALAGERTEPFVNGLAQRLAPLGVEKVILQPDLLAMFHSGTPASDGYALIAGTGAIAARIADGRLDQVAGGRGWLLGDEGSGYWIGHQVARAVVAALDGQGPPTALTSLVLEDVAMDADAESSELGSTLERLVSAVYSWQPVQLSRFARLAFEAHDDAVARQILVRASRALAALLSAVQIPTQSGPTIVGGSVLTRGILPAPESLRSALVSLVADGTPLTPVPDGVLGAAVLALRSAGVIVDDRLFRTLQDEVARARRHGPAH